MIATYPVVVAIKLYLIIVFSTLPNRLRNKPHVKLISSSVETNTIFLPYNMPTDTPLDKMRLGYG